MNYNIVDEINQEKEHACYYCGNTTKNRIIQCMNKGCREYFCNNITFNQVTGSHIYHHLTIRGHDRIKITNIMKCSCGKKNSFELCFKKNHLNQFVIKCRNCSLKSIAENPQESWVGFYTENSLSSELAGSSQDISGISLAKIQDLEKDLSKGMIKNPYEGPEKVKKAQLTYSNVYAYINVFRTLLILENQYEIHSNDDQSAKVVVPNWSENYKRFTFQLQEEKTLFKARDELALKSEDFIAEAVIDNIDRAGTVTVQLRNGEAGNPSIKKIQVKIIYNDCSFKRLETAFEKIGELNECMRSVILGEEHKYEKFKVRELEDYSAPGLPTLNSSQNQAVKRALELPIFLIQGPPGTGKTVTSASIIYHLSKNLNLCSPQLENLDKKTACISAKVSKVTNELFLRTLLKSHLLGSNHTFDPNIEDRLDLYIAESGQRLDKYDMKQEKINQEINAIQIAAKLQKRPVNKVLVCAPSNVAVDNLANKITQTGLNVVRFYSKYKQVTEQSKSRLNYYTRFLEALEEPENYQLKHLHKKMQSKRLSPIENNEYKRLELLARMKILEPVEVVCCTCSGAFDWRLSILKFQKVVVDEACQAKEPEMLLPMLLGCNQLIMVGDHMQLGPVVKCDVAERAGMGTTLFERLIKRKFESYMLNIQFRMHPAIAKIPNELFYDDKINNGIDADERVKDLGDFKWPGAAPVFFYHIPDKEEISSTGKSFVNKGEVISIKKIIERIGFGVEIGVITFYDAQKVLLSRFLDENLPQGFDLEIASVDSFQGREKDYIILSCVRSNKNLGIGFLWNFRRLNVAITRARYGLIICGNVETLVKSDPWNEIIKILKKKHLIFRGDFDDLETMIPNVNHSNGRLFMSSYSYEADSDQEADDSDSFREISDDSGEFLYADAFIDPQDYNSEDDYAHLSPFLFDQIADPNINPDNLDNSFDYENFILEEYYFGQTSQ